MKDKPPESRKETKLNAPPSLKDHLSEAVIEAEDAITNFKVRLEELEKALENLDERIIANLVGNTTNRTEIHNELVQYYEDAVQAIKQLEINLKGIQQFNAYVEEVKSQWLSHAFSRKKNPSEGFH